MGVLSKEKIITLDERIDVKSFEVKRAMVHIFPWAQVTSNKWNTRKDSYLVVLEKLEQNTATKVVKKLSQHMVGFRVFHLFDVISAIGKNWGELSCY